MLIDTEALDIPVPPRPPKLIGRPDSLVPFRLAGPTPDREYARRVAQSGPVQLLGEVSEDQLIHEYQNAGMLLHPSRVEILPGAVLQALACGLPVLGGAALGGVVRDGIEGRILPGPDVGDADPPERRIGPPRFHAVDVSAWWRIGSPRDRGGYQTCHSTARMCPPGRLHTPSSPRWAHLRRWHSLLPPSSPGPRPTATTAAATRATPPLRPTPSSALAHSRSLLAKLPDSSPAMEEPCRSTSGPA